MVLVGAVAPAAHGGAGLPPDWFFGLAHQRLGGAVLIHGSDDSLKISNIGSSGQDGVSIVLSQPAPPGSVSPDWQAVMDFGQAGALARGSRIVIQARDQFGNAVLSLAIAESGGGHADLSLDQTLCDACPLTVELLLNGVVVQSAQFAGGAPPVLASGNIGSSGNDGVQIQIRKKEFTNQFDVDLCEDIVSLPLPTPISLPNGLPPTEADAIRVRLNGLPPGTRYFRGVAVTGANVPVITVSSEALIAHELTHVVQQGGHMRGVGDVNGDGQPDVAISNIGSSGQDGVSIQRHTEFEGGGTGLKDFSVTADWGPAGALPDGSVMEFVTHINGNDGIAKSASLVISANPGGVAAVSFHPCKDPGCCQPCCPCAGVAVQAIMNGVVVDEVVHPELPEVIAVGNIGSSGQDGVSFYSGPRQTTDLSGSYGGRLAMGVRSAIAGPITLTGSSAGAVTADQVRVVVSVDPTAISSIADVSLLGANVPSFIVLGGRQRVNDLENVLKALGLLVRSAGGADLTITPDGSLSMRDCDDDGDGVSILTGEIDGAAIVIDFGPAGALPAESHRKMIPITQPDISGMALTLDEANGGQAALSIEQDVCPTCPIQVDLLHAGAVVGSQVYPPPYPAGLVVGNIGSVGRDWAVIEWRASSNGSNGQGLQLTNPASTSLTLAPRGGGGGGGGGGTFNAECVRISLVGQPSGPAADGISAIQLTGTGFFGATIAQASLSSIPKGFTVRNGTAQIAGVKKRSDTDSPLAISYALVVSNIGSSGQDGVTLHNDDEDCDGEADDADAMEIAVAPISLPPDASLVVHAHGTGGGFLAGSFFDVSWSIQNTGKTDDITADFSGIGATHSTAQVYLNGVLGHSQGAITGPPAAQAPAGSPMSKFGEIKALVGGTTSIARTIHWNHAVPITLDDGSVTPGDELRFIAEDPGSPVAGIQSMSLTGANLAGGQLVILDEAITPTPEPVCQGDISPPGGNGAVNIDDLLAVINGWGPCADPANCPADIPAPGQATGNGVVDIDDLLAVINHWGGCP